MPIQTQRTVQRDFQESAMALQVEVRRVGEITVVKCSGRIVAGQESESLHANVEKLLPEHKHIVLELAGVNFIDSSGLGMLVRLLGATRGARAQLKLCNLCKEVSHTLKLTNLHGIFQTYESETDAISAFFVQSASAEGVFRTGRAVLCLDESADVLAYLRELLRQAGYDPLTTRNVSDARILLKAAKPALVILGPSVAAPGAEGGGFRQTLGAIPVVNLQTTFSTAEAGAAAQEVLEQVRSRITPSS
jgi:anti-sigma B factor antagonist